MTAAAVTAAAAFLLVLRPELVTTGYWGVLGVCALLDAACTCAYAVAAHAADRGPR